MKGLELAPTLANVAVLFALCPELGSAARTMSGLAMGALQMLPDKAGRGETVSKQALHVLGRVVLVEGTGEELSVRLVAAGVSFWTNALDPFATLGLLDAFDVSSPLSSGLHALEKGGKDHWA